MFCAKCGKENIDGAGFCVHCGQNLTKYTPAPKDKDTFDDFPTIHPPKTHKSYDTLDVADTVDGSANIVAGQYKIVRKIGEGGMGVVYLAEDMEMGNRQVAIKVLPPVLSRSKRAVENLRREAMTAIELAHENIVRVFGFRSDGDFKFLVMEYLEGRTLEDIIEDSADGKLELKKTLEITAQIAAGLDYAHSQKPAVLHRDLKPSNVMIDSGGNVKLLDFGIARQIRDSYTKVTGKSETSGTVPYMSPEQLRGRRPTRAMDIYSLGVICYECLSGRVPFETGDIAYQIINEKPPTIEHLPENINNALRKILAKEPESRPKSGADAVKLLQNDIKTDSIKSKIKPDIKIADITTPQVIEREDTENFKTINWNKFPASIKNKCDRIAIKVRENIPQSITVKCLEGSYSFFDSSSKTIAKLIPVKPDKPMILAAFSSSKANATEYAKKLSDDISEKKVIGQPFVFTLINPQIDILAVADVFTSYIISLEKLPKPGDLMTNSIGMKLVYIPPGAFMMGSTISKLSDEKPVHKVKISKGFWLGQYEVTQAQYKAVMGTNPSRFKGDNNPVERVSWNDAMEFCRKLSRKEGRNYSLPTEAQWEYACRAGSTARFCFGDSDSKLGFYAWYWANSGKRIHEVGRKEPNDWTLYDMHGNVWEWCRDFYDSDFYRKGDKTDPENTNTASKRVCRGGSWYNNPRGCRCANRNWNVPVYADDYLGFRILLFSSGMD